MVQNYIPPKCILYNDLFKILNFPCPFRFQILNTQSGNSQIIRQ